jgi:hypothetical protein
LALSSSWLIGDASVSIDGVDALGSALDAAQHVAEAVDVHPVAHAVGSVSCTSGWSGVDGTVHVLLAGGGVGEDGGEQVFGAHAEEVGGHGAAGVAAEEREAADGGPAPAGAEQGGVGDDGLGEHALGGGGGDEVEDVGEGEAVVGPREMTRPSSVAAACSSKLKLAQNRLRRVRPQARLIRPPRGACMTSCMPPPSSKKRSATRVVSVGIRPRAAAGGEVVGELRRRAQEQGGLVAEPAGDGFAGHAAGEAVATSARSSADGGGELGGAGGGLAKPERHGGVGAGGVLDADAAGLDAADAPGVLPSRKTSPALLSMAKSSSTVPTTASSGSAMTV